MKRRTIALRCARAFLATAVICCWAECVQGQAGGVERLFPQPTAAIEKALKEMQPAAAGRLPVLDGFATSAENPLDRYQRGYYQSKFQVSTAPSGGSIVRVTVHVTAWYVDPVAAQSGYQVLTSNGRLEADLLDQLADQLAGRGVVGGTASASTSARKPFPSERSVAGQSSSKPSSSEQLSSQSSSRPIANTPDPAEPTISAPVPRLPDTRGGFSSSLAQGLAEQEKAGTHAEENKPGARVQNSLQAEALSLEEILKNQAHPSNLVAVKKNGTPVVASPSLTAKTLFMASAHDEFEMLDFNRDWVHVRVSGLSRGWIWRNNLEMPESVPEGDVPTSPVPVAAERFHVTREETAPFPGDWAPLRGKNVKIVSVEKINESEKDAGPQLKLEFAKSVLDKDYAELAQKALELSGIVVIFDSVDGGMIAAAFPTLQQWKAGKLSDAGRWHQCFFDPPETFNESGAPASQ